MKAGFVAYLVPFLVIYNPEITIMIGSPTEIVIAISTVSLGTLLLVCGVQGWALYRENIPERLLSFLAGSTLILPGTVSKLIGISLVPILLLLQIARNKRLIGNTVVLGAKRQPPDRD